MDKTSKWQPKGLGPQSLAWLAQIGVQSGADLQQMGAMHAFLRLQQALPAPPSLNLLYALVGALENRDWRDVARTDKARLVQELEGWKELLR